MLAAHKYCYYELGRHHSSLYNTDAIILIKRTFLLIQNLLRYVKLYIENYTRETNAIENNSNYTLPSANGLRT